MRSGILDPAGYGNSDSGRCSRPGKEFLMPVLFVINTTFSLGSYMLLWTNFHQLRSSICLHRINRGYPLRQSQASVRGSCISLEKSREV